MCTGEASLVLFQIGVTNNWNSILYPNMLALSGSTSDSTQYKSLALATVAAFYFCSFFIVVVYIEINILEALMIDAFNAVNISAAEEVSVIYWIQRIRSTNVCV